MSTTLISDVWHGLFYKLISKYKSFLKELHGVLNYSNIKYIFKQSKYLCGFFFYSCVLIYNPGLYFHSEKKKKTPVPKFLHSLRVKQQMCCFTFRQLTCTWISSQYHCVQAADLLSWSVWINKGQIPTAGQDCPLAVESGQHTDRACVCRRLHPDRRGCSHDAGGLPRMLWSHSGVSVSTGDSKWLIMYFIFLLNISAPL